MKALRIERDLDDLRRDVYGFATLVAWAQTGIFDTLAHGPRSLADLPGDLRALELTAPILANMGLLCREGSTWQITAAARRLHEAGSLLLGSGAELLAPLARLEEVIRQGGPARAPDGTPLVTEGGVREHDPARSRIFLEMLHRRAEEDVDEVAERVVRVLPAGAHVLDLGGGHGRYAHTLKERGMRVTLFDRPLCVELARERYGDALTYRSGDFLADPIGGPYDAAMLSNIVHGLGPEENRSLLCKLAAALAPNGRVLVKEMLLDELSFRPDEAAAFGLTMLMFTRLGRSYSLTELGAMAANAGLMVQSHTYLPDRGYSLVFLARRG